MKKSFILYHNQKEMFDDLGYEKAGELLNYIFEYSMTLERPDIKCPAVRMAFISMKNTLDLNKEKYNNVCKRNKTNGLKGGRPNNPKEPKKAGGLSCNPKEPKKADSDSDSDIDIDSGKIVRVINDSDIKDTLAQNFETFWSFYPKKRAKGQALKSWNKLQKAKQLPDITKIMDSLKALKVSKDWIKSQGQFIPYPATWLNGHGWDDVPETSAPMVSDTLIHNANVGREWLNESE